MDLNLCLSLALGLLCLTFCDSFNLETRLPVIKFGHEGSYFGFSVAEHQSFDEIRGKIEKSWLLVGAPLDQNKQPRTNHSGALWRCPITTRLRDCDQVTTDGKRNIDEDKLMPPVEDEVKDGQWLGVTVRSQGVGGKVMVCAHRYIRKGVDYRFGFGLCYTLTQRLDYEDSWEPCKGKPTDRAHEQYGSCQAGTSGLLINDTAVIGTPGPYTWRGTVFVVSVSEDFLQRDKTLYYSPLTDEQAPIDKYSYLGMSVAAGKFFGDSHLSYAAGAPRSKGTGQVVIFEIVKHYMSLMSTSLILNGEQFTSNFGYETATADVNGDKLTDLLVGAPNYFGKEAGGAVYIYLNKNYCLNCSTPIKITGKLESRFGIAIANLGDLNRDGFEDIAVGAPYEGAGAVYIYLGSKDGIIKEPSQIIRGEDFKLETFGYSLSGGLDLDGNGYPDLLVGAFESNAVVLLRSRPIVGLRSRVGPTSALVNIDPNKKGCIDYPDSNYTCFKFEACVSVQAVAERLKSSSGIKLAYKLESDVKRKVSRVWLGTDSSGSKPVTVQREITLKEEPITGDFEKCHYHTAFIQKGTKDIQSPIVFRLSYWLVQAQPRVPREGDPLPAVDDFPILNQQQAETEFEATFWKDCGENDVCESQLFVEASLDLPVYSGEKTWELVLGEHNELVLNATVQNLQESAYEAQLNIFHSPNLSYIGHKKQPGQTHSCSPVNSSLVVCSIGNPFERDQIANVVLRFDPHGLEDAESGIEFILLANSSSLLVDPQGPIKLRAVVIRRAELSLKGSARPERSYYGGAVKGESAMMYMEEVGTRVWHMYHVQNQGPWKIGRLDVVIDWPHQVGNNKEIGKWLLYMDEKPYVEAIGGGECIMGPNQVNPLDLRPQPSLTPDAVVDRSSSPLLGLDNTTNLIEDDDDDEDHGQARRRRRDVEMIVKSESVVDPISGRKQRIVRMNCETKTAKCFRFRCVVYNLQRNQEATIVIKARLWNSTLVEDYPKVDEVRIASRAKIQIPPSIVVAQNTSDDATFVETVALVDLLDQQSVEKIPPWIIIASVLAGLFVLIVVILCLSKCGFFKRTRFSDQIDSSLKDKLNPADDQDY